MRFKITILFYIKLEPIIFSRIYIYFDFVLRNITK